MKSSHIILSLLILSVSCYDRNAAVNYAYQFAYSVNHKCDGAWSCSPYAYFGSEHCNYAGEGGDCANFVSQCLIAGGHPALNKGQCRGICNAEPGAWRLSVCLPENFGWTATCGKYMAPPSYIQPGDVLVYFPDSGCSASNAHAVLVTQVGGGTAKITCHSSQQKDVDYTYMAGSKPYYKWIHFNG